MNAVAAAAALYFKATHREVARRLFVELRPSDSDISGPYAEQRFEEFVLQASRGLRGARNVYRILMGLGLAAAASALLGLLVAASRPKLEVRDSTLWCYALVTIVVLPCAYWLYQQFLGWVERAFVARRTTEEEKRIFWRSFEVVLPIPALLTEQSRAMAEINAMLLAFKVRQLRRRIGDLLEKFLGFFRS